MLLFCIGCGGRLDATSADDATVDVAPSSEASSTDVLGDYLDSDTFTWPADPILDPCRDAGWVIHVDIDGGYPIDASSATITGDVGTWSCALKNEGALLELNVSTTEPWQVALWSDWPNGQVLQPGSTYTSSNTGSYMQIKVAGQGCGSTIPVGAFTIYNLIAAQGESVTVAKLLVGFTLVCNGQATLSGCARFGD